MPRSVRLLGRAPSQLLCRFHHALQKESTRLPTLVSSVGVARHQSTATAERHRAVFAFPGQGSQYISMGKDLAKEFTSARLIFEEVDDSLQQNLSRMMFEGDESDLRQTANAQPAIVAHSAALLAVLGEHFDIGVSNEAGVFLTDTLAVMGHSLGEFTAFYAAGCFTLADVVKIVRFRGEQMQQCAPPDGGRMVALFPVKGGVEAVQEVCNMSRRATGLVCDIANINTSTQMVISGHTKSVEWAANHCTSEKIARRAVALETSAPFHCSLMSPAAKSLADYLSKMLSGNHVKDPCVDVIANATASTIRDAGQIPQNFAQQATDPVLWRESMARASCLLTDETDKIYSVGPGSTIAGFCRSERVGAPCLSISDVESIQLLSQSVGA